VDDGTGDSDLGRNQELAAFIKVPSDTPASSRRLRGITIWPFLCSLTRTEDIKLRLPKVSRADFPLMLLPVA